MKILRESQKKEVTTNAEIGDIIHVKSAVNGRESYHLINKFYNGGVCITQLGITESVTQAFREEDISAMLLCFSKTSRVNILKVIKSADIELHIKNY